MRRRTALTKIGVPGGRSIASGVSALRIPQIRRRPWTSRISTRSPGLSRLDHRGGPSPGCSSRSDSAPWPRRLADHNRARPGSAPRRKRRRSRGASGIAAARPAAMTAARDRAGRAPRVRFASPERANLTPGRAARRAAVVGSATAQRGNVNVRGTPHGSATASAAPAARTTIAVNSQRVPAGTIWAAFAFAGRTTTTAVKGSAGPVARMGTAPPSDVIRAMGSIASRARTPAFVRMVSPSARAQTSPAITAPIPAATNSTAVRAASIAPRVARRLIASVDSASATNSRRVDSSRDW